MLKNEHVYADMSIKQQVVSIMLAGLQVFEEIYWNLYFIPNNKNIIYKYYIINKHVNDVQIGIYRE